MENKFQDNRFPQTFSEIQIGTLNTGARSEPRHEEKFESESKQATPQPESCRPPLELIKFRIQQLHNRRFLLQRRQHFRRNEGNDNGGTTEEFTCADKEDVCELEQIQKELEELLVRKKQLEKQGNGPFLAQSQQDACPTFSKSETPRGGIYLLPPPQLIQEDVTPKQTVKRTPAYETPETPAVKLVPVDRLVGKSAVIQCPSCKEVVQTVTCRTVGETAWILCCLFSAMGCVSGCCLIPFFYDKVKDVQHHCPRCQALISTHHPL